MRFIIERECLIKPLQQVSNILSRRQILPMLSNLLLQVVDGTLLLTSTDLEIEIIASISLTLPHTLGKTTVHARKFFDICRGISEGEKIAVRTDEKRIIICSGRSRFFLLTESADNFPNLNNWNSEIEFTLLQSTMKYLIEKTQFSMGYQDVRYYLNGMLFEFEQHYLRSVASDGHRLAICSVLINTTLPNYSVIIPRKGVLELMRMLDNKETSLRIQVGKNNIRVYIRNFIFTSKLIEGRFPDYRQVIPKNPDKILEVNCEMLKKAFSRVSILSNERMHGVSLYIDNNQLKITANNANQEEAEEILDVIYIDDTIEISFNVNYILDILNTLKCKNVRMLLTDSLSSVQIENVEESDSTTYIVMPMRL